MPDGIDAMISSPARALVSTVHDLHDSWAFRRNGGSYRFKGVYSTYNQAEAAMPSETLHGFDHEIVADYFAETHIIFNPSDYAVLFWLSGLLPSAQPLFDFGGGVGQAFYVYQSFLNLPDHMRWIVCDVEALAKRGRRLADERQANGLDFTTDFAACNGAAIMLTTGVLQYVEADLPELLAGLSDPPEHVLINRVPMYDGESYYTIQHAHHSYAPYKVSNLHAFIRNMESTGYEKVDEWYLPRSLRIPFHPAQFVPCYHGFYFRKKHHS